MHRCLNVDEIVRLIARELVISGGNATAVRLARCCKSFEDPVLDALWTMRFNLSTLFKCFPGDVWNEGGYTVSTQTTYAPFFPQRCCSKVIQTASNGGGMGSFPEVRSKNPISQGSWRPGNPVSRGLLRHATLRNQRALAPKSDNSRFLENQGIVYFIHSIVPFPHNHYHLFRIRCAPSAQICGRFTDRKLADTLPQSTSHQYRGFANGPDDHRRCL